jgi:hypothetical protein
MTVPILLLGACMCPVLFAPSCWGQSKTPEELISFLAFQSDRSDKQAFQLGIFTCGMDSPSREATRALIRFGDSALPNIEAALGSLETRGQESEFGEGFTWILDAYAVIRHRGAFPRLRAMMAKSQASIFSDPNGERHRDIAWNNVVRRK